MRTLTIVLALCAVCAMADEAALRAVSSSTTHFATKFFKEVSASKKGENLISSPLSAHIVLSMAAYGAGGNTAKEMRQSLHLPADDAVARQGFENLIDGLNKVENVTLEVANKMYLAQNLKLKPEYKALTSDSFRSTTDELDVSKSAESAKIVNNWVDERTHHKINKIVEDDDITSDTRMLLLNAVYFKGKWAKAFKKEGTHDRDFHLDEKTKKQVPTMFINDKFVYGELPDLKAKFVELPYENKELKMIIIVPDEINGLANIEANLEHFNYTRLAKSGSEQEIQLYLPKFKIESTINLEETLQKLGMKDMFSNAANFTRITEEPVKVGKVLQKAYIEVNEEGSEAAAVTVGMVLTKSARLYPEPKAILKVDKPFYFMIVNSKDNVSLFNGHILKP